MHRLGDRLPLANAADFNARSVQILDLQQRLATHFQRAGGILGNGGGAVGDLVIVLPLENAGQRLGQSLVLNPGVAVGIGVGAPNQAGLQLHFPSKRRESSGH